MPPMTWPFSSRSGIPPGKVISPLLDTSMLNSGPPGWDSDPSSPLFMSKNRAVRAFLRAVSIGWGGQRPGTSEARPTVEQPRVNPPAEVTGGGVRLMRVMRWVHYLPCGGGQASQATT
jgi:hypothetical protein